MYATLAAMLFRSASLAIARLLAVSLAFLSSLAAPGAETNFFFARGATGQELRSVGVKTNGPTKEIWYAGEQDGQAALFQLVGTNFIATNLAALGPEGAYAFSISRDARSVVGISGDQAVLWDVATPGTVQGLGIPAGRSFSEAHGVSSGPDPTVVGFAGIGAFTWTSASGMQVFPNPPGHGGPRLYAISADGQTYVGSATTAATRSDPLVYNGGISTFLAEDGGLYSTATTVSPNGTVIGGDIDNQGAIWNTGVPLRLTLAGNPVGQVLGVTDNGFAVGSTAAGGYIYDPRTGLTSLFDDWWQIQTGSAPPVHVTSVNDILWDGEMLYFALSGSSAGAAAGLGTAPFTEVSPPSLALARIASDQIELRWPTNQNCTVESTPNLTPPRVWTTITNPAPSVSHTNYVLTLSITNAATFFRLNCP